MVKITFVPAMVVIACIGLVANIQAVAQTGNDVQTHASHAPGMQNATAPQSPDNGQAPIANGQTSEVTADWLDVDNGLWDGAAVDPGCAMCGGGGTPPDWYTLQGVRAISRSRARKMPLVYQMPKQGSFAAVEQPSTLYRVLNLPGSTVDRTSSILNINNLTLDVAAGYEATIGHYFCRDRNNNDHFVEFTFWGLNSWADSRTLTGYYVPVYDETTNYFSTQATLINAGVMTPTVVAGQEVGSLRTAYPDALLELPGATADQQTLSLAFNNGLQFDTSYRSTMNNFELDGRINPRGEPDRLVLQPNGKWRHECHPGTYMSYLYGLRFMQVDETFLFHSFSQGLFDNQIQNGIGNYNVVTHNNLLGFQIGADMTFRKCRWSWGIESKLGPYLNYATQQSQINATRLLNGAVQDTVDQRFTANRYEASLIGEVGFQATYKFRPNLMGRAAYDFMWVTGLALAPEQVQFVADPTNRVNVNGAIFSQGISLGLEWMW